MSSLIFVTNEKQILVATDTLVAAKGGEPLMFASKAIHVPHLRCIVTGTGSQGFINEWALIVSTKMIVNGIHNLDYHTPKGLRQLWKTYCTDRAEGVQATVYQFGISEANRRVQSFVYRSENEFESESLDYGTVTIPQVAVPEGNLFELIPDMMQQQRDDQAPLPADTRLHIGGEIYGLYLTSEGCNSIKLGQFNDFKDQDRTIFHNYDAD